MQARLDHAREMVRIRRQTVEHPFGMIKAWMGDRKFVDKPAMTDAESKDFVAFVKTLNDGYKPGG